jgi:DNA-binding CsgD family transcriptional regulator
VLASAFVVLRAYADQELGRLDDAQAGAEEALESGLISGGSQVAFFASAVLSWTALMRGRPDAAVEHGQAMLEYMGAAPYNQAGSTIADARLALGDPQGALAALDASGWVRPEMVTFDRVRAAEVAVRVLLACGRLEEAAEWAGRVAAEGGGRRTSVFGAAVALAQAAVLLARGKGAEAARVAVDGASAADAGYGPVWAGRCRILAGEAFAAAGDAAAARAQLHRAVAQLETCGAWGHRDAALRALRRLGDRPRALVMTGTATLADGPLSALTPREREVAELVGEGQTNAQIAARLQLSERTVEKHVSSMLGKLGVPSRTGVVRLLAAEDRHAGAGAATST